MEIRPTIEINMALTLTYSVSTVRFIAGTLAVLCWLSLLLQWTLLYGRVNHSVRHTLARFFGYFTILSNTLVAISFSLWFIYPVDRLSGTLQATLFTAICVYIIIVAVIYHALLRKLAVLQGLDQLVNAMLHTWLPVSYIVCWQLLMPAGLLDFTLIPYFLIFPVLYLVYVLLLGYKTDHYPYPFINVLESGYAAVLRNAVFITLGFILLSCLLIWWKS
ncbi:Pr6Pr family membrane protein [Arachidicoccus terrestris]|uniref:Pr6Pr family membrane protein n=1 Tax=Arachidicoccus terrestris TaxID=2875539 RepID=UPI001CC37D3F|nr:Pr6Pr family membrane protein [Arachidicoccus terrestris]UAY56841.1 Pr6Pr family membrane protein [Arachidicoccus terrestris]